MESNKSTVGGRIAALRKTAGLKQRELADKITVSRELVNLWENDLRQIKGDDIARLADALGTTCDYLLRGVSSENLNIHFATGLSDEGIAAIASISDNQRTVFNELIASEHFKELVSLLALYEHHLFAMELDDMRHELAEEESAARGHGYIDLRLEWKRNNAERRGIKADLIETVLEMTKEIDTRYSERKDKNRKR